MPRATIVGLGLIGGSIGMALRAHGWFVAYLDPHVEPHEAIGSGAADQRVDDLGGMDVVVLATPADVAVELLRNLTAPRITSVCSVMRPLREAADERGTNFIAGHPLAGSEMRTLAAARADLFHGKRWFLDRDDDLVVRLIADCEAIPDLIDPAAHDAALALTSHLPQVLSTALGAYLEAQGVDVTRFGGTGLQSFLRLAGSDATVWAPVFEGNRQNLAASAADVARIAQSIIEGDAEAFERARRVWARFNQVSSAPQ